MTDRLLLVCLILIWLGSLTPARASSEVVLCETNGPRARIVVGSNDRLAQAAATWCRDYLQCRGYAVEPAPARRPLWNKAPLWVLETRDQCPVAASLGIDISFLDKGRADAYILKIYSRNGQPIVVIIGRNGQGVRSGVARLVALMHERSGKLIASQIHEQRTPFFPIRRLHVCPTGRIAQGGNKIWADTLWTNWSDDRLKKYAEQLWLLGFNSVELAEIRGYRGAFSDEELAKSVTPKIIVFAKALRENGLQVSQFIWGQSLFSEGDNLCWNSPRERKAMEAEFHRLATTYGKYVDHIVVHVGDPGGCKRNGCDAYVTTQQIATFLLNEYRKANPNVTATLSTWANEGFYQGTPNVKFLDETYSPKELSIALHRWYDGKKCSLILGAGRSCDIWGWYMSDYELALDMSLLMRRLDHYYSSLPPVASTQIRAISTEINFSGWPQIINAYVSAQKMWSPQRSLKDIEREFCAGMFGDENAEAMMAVYQACEECVHPERYFGFIPSSDCTPDVFGTPDYNRQLRSALGLARTVKLDPAHSSRFTTATSPQSLVDYLIRNLSLISVFSDAQEKLNAAKKAGAHHSELQTILENAQKNAAPYSIDPDYPFLLGRLQRSAGATE